MNARQIESTVARFYGYRRNMIVPNVSWGSALEVDLVVLRKSGRKRLKLKSVSDIKADLKNNA